MLISETSSAKNGSEILRMIRPIRWVCLPRRARAIGLGEYPNSAATFRTRFRVFSLKNSEVSPLKMRETVLCETPASPATSLAVGLDPLFFLAFLLERLSMQAAVVGKGGTKGVLCIRIIAYVCVESTGCLS